MVDGQVHFVWNKWCGWFFKKMFKVQKKYQGFNIKIQLSGFSLKKSALITLVDKRVTTRRRQISMAHTLQFASPHTSFMCSPYRVISSSWFAPDGSGLQTLSPTSSEPSQSQTTQDGSPSQIPTWPRSIE